MMTKKMLKYGAMILALASGAALTASKAMAQTYPIPAGGPFLTLPKLKPVTEIYIRGLKYKDHSANTKLSAAQVNAGDFFQITTASLYYGGLTGVPLPTIKVVIQDVNAPSSSSGGFTVFELRNVSPRGQTLIVQSPSLPVLRNRTYHVSVFMYAANGARHYANAGLLTVH